MSGELAFRQGDQTQAEAATRRARDAAAVAGDTIGEASELANLADLAMETDDDVAAAESLRRDAETNGSQWS